MDELNRFLAAMNERPKPKKKKKRPASPLGSLVVTQLEGCDEPGCACGRGASVVIVIDKQSYYLIDTSAELRQIVSDLEEIGRKTWGGSDARTSSDHDQ